jgi:hypothetical protein
VWTDGKQVALMMPTNPPFVKCRDCNQCYWLDDAEDAETIFGWSAEDANERARQNSAELVQEPCEGDYYQALDAGVADTPEREKLLRVLAWWLSNDEYRGLAPDQHVSLICSGPRWENLTALVRLLDETCEEDRIMKAEALRQMGEFDSAKRLLSCVDSPEFTNAVRKLQSLCDQKDSTVRLLQLCGIELE